MNIFLECLDNLENSRQLLSAIASGRVPAFATGVIDSQKAHLAYYLMRRSGKKAFYITQDELHAQAVLEDLRFFLGGSALLYPARDLIFYAADVHSADITKRRVTVLDALIAGECEALVLPADALLERIAPPDAMKAATLDLETGKTYPLSLLIENLVKIGYERTDFVEGPGRFAVRGGILDVFPASGENPVRVEYWGDEIDSIRLIDAASQRSVEKLDSAHIFPISETLRGGADACVLDYLPRGSLVFFDEPARIDEHIKTVEAEFHENVGRDALSAPDAAGRMKDVLSRVFAYDDVLRKTEPFSVILFAALMHRADNFVIKTATHFAVKPAGTFRNQLSLLVDDMKHWKSLRYRVAVLAGGRTRAEHIADELRKNGIISTFYENPENAALSPDSVCIIRGSLSGGFEYAQAAFAVVTDRELFGSERAKKRVRRKKASKIESFTDLKIGDYIVHDSHGVGIYKGIAQETIDGVVKDYIVLLYKDGGVLKVNVNQMDAVQKYIGGEEAKIRLNKLGGGEWEKQKSRTRAAVKELAADLVKLYASRFEAKGFIYSPDTVWQKEFEEMFEFEETDDQIAAIEDVKKDMESPRVMERLICGDVGYGKTEVAIRAAFKAVQDGKQVAYLVPTTILAQQHYNTFVRRMAQFPVNVELLSRFRTPKQQKESLKRLETGLSEIVIGTHRLLSADVAFKDLGLVIVDEEQRFGVAHKEKLKRLKQNVDVLTLTATPIPRTLHMSLSGIRDISILEEPPHERLPVQTYVMEYNPLFVREAINRELARGGQVYYLHNRVRSIADIAARVQALAPAATVRYAHGQMTERELEGVMMDFIDGAVDVLVTTTIIETGLDIPNVNTIIVQDSDFMGLSQLYQLRGRVGRSNRQAYAYLMYRKDKILEENAEKRLQTIKEFTEFGSGFKVAMRDMEIRGAGNILGGEQHGHMDAVGYDMYCRLLAEAVRELSAGSRRGDYQSPAPAGAEDFESSFETYVDFNLDAYIPPEYIANEEQKLEIYKKISLIQNEQDYYDVQEEIEDRFGGLPAVVQILLDVALMKAAAHKIGVTQLTHRRGSVFIKFMPDAPVDVDKLTAALKAAPDKLKLSAGLNTVLQYNIPNAGPREDPKPDPKALYNLLSSLA